MVLAGSGFGIVLSTTLGAFWNSGVGTGTSVAATAALNAPPSPNATAPLNSATVAVSWTASRLTSGQSAQGYYVTRQRNSDGAAFPACGTSPTSPTTALSCNDTSVTDGDYHYTVTAFFASWTATSSASATVSVVNDTTLPSVTVTSITPNPNGNGYNSSSPVTIELAASAGAGIASITYSIDSGSPVVVSSPTATITVTGEGIHSVTYDALDNAGNTSETATVLVRIDSVVPDPPSAPALTTASDSGISTTDRITKVTKPVFTGTAETGTVVTLYEGATALGSAVATGGTYTITSNTLVSGNHTVAVRATDAAGNISGASTSTTITLDTTVPAAPSTPFLIATSDSGRSSTDRVTNVSAPTLTGTAGEDGLTVTMYSSTTPIGNAVTSGNAYSITSISLVAGTKSITAKATDVAGNVSAASPSTSVTIDVTAPSTPSTPTLAAASDTGRSNADRITKITTPTLTGTTTAGYILTLYDGTVVLATTAAGPTTYSIITPVLTDGVHSLTIKAADIAGNVSLASTARVVTIDTIAPPAPTGPTLTTASDTGKSTTDRITNKTTPIVTGANESRAIVVLYDGTTQVGTVTTSASTYSITSSLLTPGIHTLTSTATDIAGNLGPANTGTTITIDTTAPDAPSPPLLTTASDTGISAVDAITKLTTPAMTGSAEIGVTVALLNGVTSVGTNVATSGTYTITSSTLTSGVKSMTARATDVAGNIGVASTITTVTIDITVPTVTINQATSQSDPTTVSPVNFTAIFSEPVYGLTGTGITYVGTAGGTTATITGATNTYNVAVSGMTKTGTVIPRVAASKVTDVAGNLNTISTTTDSTVTFTDATAPTVTITNFVANVDLTATATGTASTGPGDNLTVTVVICKINTYPCAAANIKATLTTSVNATSGAWSTTSAALGTNPVLYARATQTDLQANTGQSPIAGPIATPPPAAPLAAQTAIALARDGLTAPPASSTTPPSSEIVTTSTQTPATTTTVASSPTTTQPSTTSDASTAGPNAPTSTTTTIMSEGVASTTPGDVTTSAHSGPTSTTTGSPSTTAAATPTLSTADVTSVAPATTTTTTTTFANV